MPTEFRAIEAYLSHFQKLQDIDNMVLSQVPDVNADQKVPQMNAFARLLGEDKMLSDIKVERDSFNYLQMTDSFSLTEDMKLPPVSSITCTPVDVNDQQLSSEHCPQLLDLDQVNGQDLTFYPEPVPGLLHIKQEVPDVPTGCCDYSGDTYNYPQNSPMFDEDSQVESVETFLIKQMKQDIDIACTSLTISSDPMSWSVEQTQKWILWTLQQYGLPTIDARMFHTTGQSLCSMTEIDFRMRSADCGSTLYSQLEIWRNACTLYRQSPNPIKQEMYNENSYMVYGGEMMMQPTPSVSPAPSTSSTDSNSMSSTGPMSSNSLDFDFVTMSFEREAVPQKLRPATHEHKQTIHLWQFLKELLVNAHAHGNCIKWLDRAKGIFKIEDSSRVARLWGKRKNRPAMNYDKLSRSIRQYYKKGIIKKTEHSKRLVYQFCTPYLL